MLTARLDQLALRRSLPALYLLEATVFAVLALIAEGTSCCRWCSRWRWSTGRWPSRAVG